MTPLEASISAVAASYPARCDCNGCAGCQDEDGKDLGECPGEGLVNDLCPRCRAGHGYPARTAEAEPEERPYGWLLAHGWTRAEALGHEGANEGRGDMSPRNWRFHVVLHNLRGARDILAQVRGYRPQYDVPRVLFGGGRVPYAKQAKFGWVSAAELRVYERREGRILWALRELLKQRARVRRVAREKRQMTIDFDKRAEIDARVADAGPAMLSAERLGANPRHSSESNEHMTPPEVVAPAILTMGGIDCDPASCELAQSYIEAEVFYTIEDDGFNRPWRGRVFLNPPGGLCDALGRRVIPKSVGREGCRVTGACGLAPGHAHEGVQSSAKAWWFRAMRQFAAGNATELVYVGFSLEILQTTQADPPELQWLEPIVAPVPLDFVLCYPSARVRYLSLRDGRLQPGGSPTHSSFICYVGPNVHEFRRAFSGLGRVVVPEGAAQVVQQLRSMRVELPVRAAE